MNTIPWNRRFFAGLMLATGWVAHPLMAQDSPKASAGGAQSPAEFKRSAMTDSQVLCAVGDYDNGETVLLSANRAKAGTEQYQVESANRLIRMALVMAAQGRGKAAEELTRRALAHLRQVGAEAEAGVRANAEELAGVIYERLAGNADKARQSYQNALRLFPGSAQAKESLDRLNRAAAIAAPAQRNGG